MATKNDSGTGGHTKFSRRRWLRACIQTETEGLQMALHLNLGSSVGHVWRHTVALLLQFSDKIGEAPY